MLLKCSKIRLFFLKCYSMYLIVFNDDHIITKTLDLHLKLNLKFCSASIMCKCCI